MRIRRLILAGFITPVIAAASSCGGSAADHASAPLTSGIGRAERPAPAGYQWAGSSKQGVWFAVPGSWAALNLATMSSSEILRRLGLKDSTRAPIVYSLAQLIPYDAFAVVDVASARRSPNGYATNGSAFCFSAPRHVSSISDLISYIRATSAQDIIFDHITIDGFPGVKARLTATDKTGIPISKTQYSALTDHHNVCAVTLSTVSPATYQQIFDKIGETIRFS